MARTVIVAALAVALVQTAGRASYGPEGLRIAAMATSGTARA